MRILVLIVQFPPDVNAAGRLMAELCQGLEAQGHRVTIITAFPHYERFRVWDEFRGKLFQRGTYKGLDVIRLWVYASGKKHSMLHRLLSYLSFCLSATVAGLLNRQHYDLILCSNGSFFTGVAASVIGRLRGIPFVYNVQDLYPETPVQAGQLRNPWAVAGLERIERFMYKHAAHVSVICDGFRASLLRKDVPADKVTTIPNFVDTNFIRVLPKANRFSREHGLEDKFVVLHAGNLGYVYDFETLFDAAESLRDDSNIVFLIVGNGVVRGRLEQRAATLPNVRILPYQPQDTVPLLRATADVQLALYRAGAGRYSMPSKVYEIMASARPVLAGAEVGTDLWRLITNTQCGLCVDPGDSRSLATAIRLLQQDAPLRKQMGERGRLEVEKVYSQQAVVAQYDALCRRVGVLPEIRPLADKPVAL